MSAGAVNLLVLVGILAIVTAFVAITYVAATRRGGRKTRRSGLPSREGQRKVNPKTGDLFR